MTRILGIDPGTKGAIAVIDTDEWTLGVIDMPLEVIGKAKNIVSSSGLIETVRNGDADHAFLELVHSSPQQGVVSAFSFGDGYGCARTAVLADAISLWLIRPQEWKAATATPKDKRQATTRAVQLFGSASRSLFYGPRGGVLDGRAEAALIAFYGCLKLKFQPTRALEIVEYPAP